MRGLWTWSGIRLSVVFSIATNLPDEYALRNDVELTERVNVINAKLRKESVVEKPKRVYDQHILKYTDLDQLTRGGVSFGVHRDQCMKVNGVGGTDSFGKWLLLSTKAMQEAERARAEAERARAERVELGEQERLCVAQMDRMNGDAFSGGTQRTLLDAGPVQFGLAASCSWPPFFSLQALGNRQKART